MLIASTSCAFAFLVAPPRAGNFAVSTRSSTRVGTVILESYGAWEPAGLDASMMEDQEDMMDGIRCVRRCLRETKIVLPLLKRIASRDFFSYYAMNTIPQCMYFPTELEGCDVDRCEITAVRNKDVPPELLARDLSESGFTIDGWCRKDMPSDFTEYYDLRNCQPRDTGYDGSEVWRFIQYARCLRIEVESRA